MKIPSTLVCVLIVWAASFLTSPAQVLWTVGSDDNGWPVGDGGGANATFVQENGVINPLPGDPASPEIDQQADNDYYLAGQYYDVISSVTAFYGDYVPVGIVAANEEAAERAFAGSDNDLRYHFNLPTSLLPDDMLSVTFDALNLDTSAPDPRYGIEVYVNGVLVQPQIIIHPAQLNQAFTTPQFSLASVNAEVGFGFDNIVSLKGISYSGDGGGSWMGFDYVQLNQPTEVIPPPVFPWAVGMDDDSWPVGDGGGPNATFVQENGVINPLPGDPASPEIDQQADNDYYFAGQYTTPIASVIAAYGDYTPVGLVPVNEEAAERAFAGGDNDLRYHFNLPNELSPGDRVSVTFDALNLDESDVDPRYGVEVYFNGVLVQPEITIRPGQLGQTFTTPPFTLGSVNAQTGSGFDNIVSLRGINHSAEGGGNWMGIDYVQLNPSTTVIPPPVLPWSVGLDDDAWPVGDGGGPNTTFVEGNGVVNPLPGDPASPEIDQQADNDYYFAGAYTTVIDSVVAAYGPYAPVGLVPVNEEAAERGFADNDKELRYHFNLPIGIQPNDLLSVTFDALNLDESGLDPRYGIEVYFNGLLVQTQIVIRPAQLGQAFSTPQFTLASVNAQVGPGFDNIVSLRGISYEGDGGGNGMGIDYVQLNPTPKVTFPWAVGRKDNGWPAGDGGGPNASFVQENGVINPLPGNPASPEVDQQADNDYYFAGSYTTPIDSVVTAYGNYTPVGLVFANEEAAERAFAGGDNDLRYHFNLPGSLQPDDLLAVRFAANNLDGNGADARYGVEVYFNGVLVKDQVVIRTADLNTDIATQPFTLASVNAQVGPGFDNIVSLKGINYNADGGGNWMGIDYIQLNPVRPSPFPWAVGMDDDGWPVGDGGGPNATFVQENGVINPLPGNPSSPEVDGQADNDYYFAGEYTTTIDSVTALYGGYTPVGLVPVNEEAAERAFAGGDNDLRYHFNLPDTLKPEDMVSVTFDPLNLDDPANPANTDLRYGVEVYFNGVLVQDEIVVRPPDLGTAFTTPPFSLASVNAQVGSGFDNIVSLRGINHNAEGGGNWMGIDYVQLNPIALRLLPPVVIDGQVFLDWTGTGSLESAPTVLGPWTPVTPTPTPPYAEAVVPGENRFFRLRQ